MSTLPSPEHKPPTEATAPPRPTVSPYSDVQELALEWQEDNQDHLRGVSAIESAFRSYGYGVKQIFCEQYGDVVGGPEAPENDSIAKQEFLYSGPKQWRAFHVLEA